MKIVVTGGCGYIGSHIARYFKQHDKNNQIYIIDRERRDHTLKNIDAFLHADYASRAATMWIEEILPDVVVHCASDIRVAESVENPGKYYYNNVAKTIELLNCLKNLERKPLVLFSSSASVYGNPTQFPITESAPIQPISPYGSTKAMTERILADYNQAYGLGSVCFRYFNACGAEPVHYDLGQEPGASHIIARVLESQINNNTFVLNGTDYSTTDGTCIRDYIHVWDLADAHLRAIEWHKHNQTPQALAVNLGTNHGISNQDIIRYVSDKYGPFNVEHGPRRPGDPDQLIADASLAKKVLGWEPYYSTIDQIIDSAYRWYTREF